jgi:gas vesicle protein
MEFLQTSIKRVNQETGREVGAPTGKGTSDIWNILDKRFPELISAFKISAGISYEDIASMKGGDLTKHIDEFKESYRGRHRKQVDEAMEFLQTSIKRVNQETGREVGAPTGKGTSDIWNILDKRFPELINVLKDFINQINNIPLPTTSKVGTPSGA